MLSFRNKGLRIAKCQFGMEYRAFRSLKIESYMLGVVAGFSYSHGRFPFFQRARLYVGLRLRTVSRPDVLALRGDYIRHGSDHDDVGNTLPTPGSGAQGH